MSMPSRLQSRRPRLVLALGVVGAALGLLLVVNVMYVKIGEATGTDLPKAEFALTLPRTLLGGRYELAQDDSGLVGRKMEEADARDPAVEVTRALLARYSLHGDRTKGALVLSGFYGRIGNPDRVSAAALRSDGRAAGATVAVPPEDVTPSGSDVKVSCEILTRKPAASTVITYPVCSWTDGNTSAVVSQMAFGTTDPDLDLDSAARTTLEVRSEIRKAIR
ncbi:hypothetical protein [Streptomyces sp. NPDC001401]|uniref:hypothetical protein n=1 Tax=Streptomyces sp. NPDC001401 TaxID=3364570 RepID=UPI0036A26246